MNTTLTPHPALASLEKLARQLDALATRSSLAAAARIGMSTVGREGGVRGSSPSRLSPRQATPWVQQWRSHDYGRRLARWQRTSQPGTPTTGHA